jgi:Na+/melibiose symporter-like transporter
MCFSPAAERTISAPLRECAMSLGTILIIIVIIYLLGGFSGRFGGYGYGLGHSGMGLGGVVLVVLLVLVLLGKL